MHQGEILSRMSMKVTQMTIVLFLTWSLQSCVITNTPGFYNGYKKLDVNSKGNIIFIKDGDDITKDRLNIDIIYAINGKQLLYQLQLEDTSLVYFFSPNCGADACVPISNVADFCQQKGYKLFVVIEYYDNLNITKVLNPTNVPLYSVNHFYYKTAYCNKYIKLFLKDLLDKKGEYYGQRYFLFNKGENLPFNYILPAYNKRFDAMAE